MLSLAPMSLRLSGPRRSCRTLLGACLLVATSLGCSRNDPQQLPEWTPADHDNQTEPKAGQVDVDNPAPGMPSGEKLGLNDVVLATWKQNCVTCHGIIGRGDGPQAAATRPRDLSDPTWQRVTVDSEIIFAIKKGRGRMPAFAQIPDETLQGLVRLIRMLNAQPPAVPDTAAAPATTGPSPGSSSNSAAPIASGATLPANHPPVGNSSPGATLPANHPPLGNSSAATTAP